MEKQKLFLWLSILLLCVLAACTSCSSEEGDTNGPLPMQGDEEIMISEGQVTEDDFEKFEGQLGLIINARNIAKKGFVPTIAEITIDAVNHEFSETTDIDPVTFMGQVSIAVEGLSEEAVFELNEGVRTTVSISDSDGNVIIEQELSAAIFTANPNPTALNVASLEETEAINAVVLKEDTPYYMQQVDSDGTPLSLASRVNRNAGFNNIMTRSSGVTFSGVEMEPDFVFNFVPIAGEENTYAIRIQSDGRFFSIANGTTIAGQTVDAVRLSFFETFEEIATRPDFESYKFIVQRVADGIYRLVSKPTDRTVKVRRGIGFVLDSGNEALIRIIATDLEWRAISLGTSFLSPILSAPGTDFGANSTLTNCGTGSLSQTVGNNEEVTITNTVSWEESFSLTTSISTKVSATVETEISADFFGASASQSSSITSEVEASVSATAGVTTFDSAAEELTETIFFERTVTVPPGRASLVFDVAQIYDNTKIQFVQRFRLTATDSESGLPLTGEELRSQLQFSRFSGVVSQTGPDFIDITVKGTTILGKVLSAMSEVQDIAASCN